MIKKWRSALIYNYLFAKYSTKKFLNKFKKFINSPYKTAFILREICVRYGKYKEDIDCDGISEYSYFGPIYYYSGYGLIYFNITLFNKDFYWYPIKLDKR